jgi:hypothetical protein
LTKYGPGTAARNVVASAGEFGVVAARFPAPVVVSEVAVLSLTASTTSPFAADTVSVGLNGVLLRRGSASRATNTRVPAAAAIRKVSVSVGDASVPLR